ncbi:hypothetical protein Lalb_Chr18g0059781 [Lupinus albus]|uniref:Uncharacterized protein n=1 Tax=Lupinus albus TaxID=3870 RepID=A0A6A4P424_LUPAL|nr:hypothetical protein Lalb_Chr18g0059781 [Lupinus albus]
MHEYRLPNNPSNTPSVTAPRRIPSGLMIGFCAEYTRKVTVLATF